MSKRRNLSRGNKRHAKRRFIQFLKYLDDKGRLLLSGDFDGNPIVFDNTSRIVLPVDDARDFDGDVYPVDKVSIYIRSMIKGFIFRF